MARPDREWAAEVPAPDEYADGDPDDNPNLDCLRPSQKHPANLLIVELVCDPRLQCPASEGETYPREYLRGKDDAEHGKQPFENEAAPVSNEPRTMDSRRLKTSATTPVGTSKRKADTSNMVPTCMNSRGLRPASTIRYTDEMNAYIMKAVVVNQQERDSCGAEKICCDEEEKASSLTALL